MNVAITINGRTFGQAGFALLTTRRDDESPADHARRIARQIGVGCVITTYPESDDAYDHAADDIAAHDEWLYESDHDVAS